MKSTEESGDSNFLSDIPKVNLLYSIPPDYILVFPGSHKDYFLAPNHNPLYMEQSKVENLDQRNNKDLPPCFHHQEYEDHKIDNLS